VSVEEEETKEMKKFVTKAIGSKWAIQSYLSHN
jgi:hypothetical protein